MAKWITNAQIAKMSYNELAQKLRSEELSETRLKSYYSGARRKALDRAARVAKSEFGEIADKVHFNKVKNLPTTQALLHEIADVNRFLNSKKSTITGQKETREKLINVADKMGFDISQDDYIKFRQFMEWFKNSEFAKLYDSDAPELPQAFEEGSTPQDWQRIFKAFVERDARNAERKNS